MDCKRTFCAGCNAVFLFPESTACDEQVSWSIRHVEIHKLHGSNTTSPDVPGRGEDAGSIVVQLTDADVAASNAWTREYYAQRVKSAREVAADMRALKMPDTFTEPQRAAMGWVARTVADALDDVARRTATDLPKLSEREH